MWSPRSRCSIPTWAGGADRRGTCGGGTTPSCHGPDEARRNLELQVVKGQARPGIKRFALEQVAQVGECVVVAGRWEMADGSLEDAGRFYQVLRIRGGLIVDIQGCTGRRAAMAYARRAP